MKKIILSDTFSIQMLNQNTGCQFEQVSLDKVKELLRDGFTSAIASQGVANVLSSLLEFEVMKDTIQPILDDNDDLIVFQLVKGKLTEDTTILPDKFTYQFWKVSFAKEWKIVLYKFDELREYDHSEVSSPQELYDRLKEEWDRIDDSYFFKVYHYGVMTFDSECNIDDEDSFFGLEISDNPTRKYIYNSLQDLKYEWRKRKDLKEYKRIKKRYNLD